MGRVYIEVQTMSNLGSHSGSNREAPEVSSCYVISPDDIAVYIRRVRELAPPLLSATIGSIFVEDWARVMSQNLRALFVPKNLKLIIACMFFRGEPAAWFDREVQPRLYRWNKFRSSLERNFGSFGVDWERRMVKEFGNSTDDAIDGGFGRYEGVGPSSAPDRDAGGSSSDDGDDKEDPEEDPEEELDGTETQEKGAVCEG